MKTDFLNEAMKIKEEIISWRRKLHTMPEIGLNLPNTVDFIKKALDEMGIKYEVIAGGSCIVCLLGKGERCFMLRSDIDGLPIAEETGLEFASENGCMHACGHDMHAATLLGAAKILKEHENELKGVVKLLFQAGEETFSGAKAAIGCGVMENPKVDAAFAMHVFSAVPYGRIIYGSNPMAGVYGFKIKLTGRGGHGSEPEKCIDPINTGVHIHLALQEIVSRESSPLNPVAITIGKFEAGHAANIIPEYAELQGTMRFFDKNTADYIIKRINEVVKSVAETYRTKAEIEVLSYVPSVKCSHEFIDEALNSIHEILPDISAVPEFNIMGSEDFAFISDIVPAVYFGMGAAVDGRDDLPRQHNPKAKFNDECLSMCSAIYANVAVNWLANH